MTQQADALRAALVEQLKQQKNITGARVEQAFRIVPRHLFVPEVSLDKAYADEAIPTKFIDNITVSSISQPAIVAIMLEQLAPGEGERVLEVGAGTGYNAALMAHLVGAQGHVTTIDIDQDIVDAARENLAHANVTNVQVVCADGGFGYAPNAPYDAVIATVGIWDIPIAWFEQLRDGGRLVAPIRFGAVQKSLAFQRVGNSLVSQSLVGCGFMHLRGEFAGPQELVSIEGIALRVDDATQVNVNAMQTLFAQSPRQVGIGIEGDEFRKLLDYLALRGEPMLGVFGAQEKFGFVIGMGLLSNDSSVTLVTYPNYSDPPSPYLTVFGNDDALNQFKKHLHEWQARGRPDLDQAKISAAPIGTLPNGSDKIMLRKRWMEYKIDF